MPKGSLALVGSGEYLPAMASLEQSIAIKNPVDLDHSEIVAALPAGWGHGSHIRSYQFLVYSK